MSGSKLFTGSVMAKAYRRSKGGRPVPYPDGSGRILEDQIVVGEMWEPYVELGYVVPIIGEVNPAMFDEPPPPPPEVPVVRVHVGPTVQQMADAVARQPKEEKPKKKRKMTIMEQARMVVTKTPPPTVRASARDVLRQRKRNQED